MSLDTLRTTLLRCALINYGILMLWFLAFVMAHDWVYLLHGRWFRLSVEQFDMIHYAGMAVYKIGVLLVNVAPWIALHLARRP